MTATSELQLLVAVRAHLAASDKAAEEQRNQSLAMATKLESTAEMHVKELELIADEHVKALEDKDAALANKDTALADKDTELADKDAELAKNVAELAEKEGGLARTRTELAKLDIEKEQADITITALRSEKVELESELAAAKETGESNEVELSKLSASLADKEEQLKEAERKKSNVKLALHGARKGKTAAKAEVKALQSQVAELTANSSRWTALAGEERSAKVDHTLKLARTNGQLEHAKELLRQVREDKAKIEQAKIKDDESSAAAAAAMYEVSSQLTTLLKDKDALLAENEALNTKFAEATTLSGFLKAKLPFYKPKH